MTNAYAEHMERLRQLEAASAMLAALKRIEAGGFAMPRQTTRNIARAAIAQAEAAGIKVQS